MRADVLWLLGLSASVLAIAIDMRRLGANRVGVPVSVWTVICLLIGPVALVPYLMFRKAARQELIGAACQLLGQKSDPPAMRLARLRTLYEVGLIGPSIYSFLIRTMKGKQCRQ